ncbi:hypothetical protein SALBM135S_03703 [Streptomyces alboniger]
MSSLPEAGIPAAGPDRTTLGDHVLGQLRRLGATVGLSEADTALYGQILLDSLRRLRPAAVVPPPGVAQLPLR